MASIYIVPRDAYTIIQEILHNKSGTLEQYTKLTDIMDALGDFGTFQLGERYRIKMIKNARIIDDTDWSKHPISNREKLRQEYALCKILGHINLQVQNRQKSHGIYL